MGRTAASLSIDIADIVILGNKLSKLNELHSISRLSLRLSSENITIALGVKIAVMAASVFGLASLWAAVFADVGAALLTVLNSIKIFLWRKIG
jgi:Cd2+/Zn2+-exporting ATPase